MVCNSTIAKSPYRRSYLKTRSEKDLVSAHSVFISRYVPKQTDQPEGGILRNGLLFEIRMFNNIAFRKIFYHRYKIIGDL